jgi:hypothetical protein
VDYAANTPLSGISVSIASFDHGAPTSPVATTTATGAFTFTTSPGTYLLVIGSNTSGDTTTTLHQKITLTAGVNALAFVVPPTEPNVTYTAAQMSGNYRLMALAGNQLSCVAGANAGRVAASIPQLVPDEALMEYAVALAQEEAGQNTDTPSPLFAGVLSIGASLGLTAFGGATTSVGFSPCSSWTGQAYSYVNGNPPYAFATSSTNVWYGAQQISSAGAVPYGAQLWSPDPR